MSRSVIAAQVLLCAMALAACGSAGQQTSGAQPAGSSPAGPSTPAATPATPATSAPAGGGSASTGAASTACATAHLTVTVDVQQGGAAAGSAYYPVDFTNTGASPCTLFGYPGVSFVTHGGSQLGKAATRNGSRPAALVTLQPGGDAHAFVQVADAGNYNATDCQPVTAHLLRVYPPGQTAARSTTFTTQACSARLPAKLGSQLSVFPVQSGKGRMGETP